MGQRSDGVTEISPSPHGSVHRYHCHRLRCHFHWEVACQWERRNRPLLEEEEEEVEGRMVQRAAIMPAAFVHWRQL